MYYFVLCPYLQCAQKTQAKRDSPVSHSLPLHVLGVEVVRMV